MMKSQSKFKTIILVLFFINAFIEIIGETLHCKPIIYICKPLIPILIIFLYHFTSSIKSNLFILILIFSSITNVLFIPSSNTFLFYGIIAFALHRILMLIYIFINITISNSKIFLLSTLPIILVFYYLFIESSSVPNNSYLILLLQIILLALLVGIALSNYINNDNLQNTYLMISALLFAGLQLVIYIEKYFLITEDFTVLRPIAMSLNVMAFFSFYKFVIVTEQIKLQK